jgi:hypothetical protein
MICLMSACLILLHLFALIFGEDPWSHACLDELIGLFLCHGFKHKLWPLFAFYWACEPILYLFGSYWYWVCWDDMVCTMCIICLRLYDAQCSSFISLIMCLSMSLTLLYGWAYSYNASLHISQPMFVSSVWFISYLYSLALVMCFKWYRGSDDSMFMHFIFKFKNYNWCTNLGELPYFI